MLRMVSKIEAWKRKAGRYKPAATQSVRLELPTLHAAQSHIKTHGKRYNVLVCGRRFGKTTLLLTLLLEVAMRGQPVAWFAPTYKLLEDVWREAVRLTLPIQTNRQQQQKRLELRGGGCIDFWTLEDPHTVARGRKYARIAIDEAAMVRHLQEAWEAAISPTLLDYQGDAWFCSTPKGENYFKQLSEKTAPNWAVFHYSSYDNPYILPSEIDEKRLEMPELKFRQEYLAEFVTAEGTKIKREWLKSLPPPPNLEVVMGVDLAISSKADADYTAAVILGRDSTGKLWVLHAERIRAPFNQVLEFIKRLAATWKPRSIGIEQVQYQAAVVQELLRQTNLPVVGIRPDKDKITRFQPLEVRYEQGLVYHAPTLAADFEAELLAFPLGKHDDMVDALAYAHRVLGGVSSFSVRASSAG